MFREVSRVLLAFCAICLLACATPEPNTGPEVFRGEYESAVAAMRHHGLRPLPRPLGAIGFYVAPSMEALQQWCENRPCSGNFSQGVISLPPRPEDSCGWMSDPETGSMSRYASEVIHEILHALGMQHGKEMDAIQLTGWITFACAYCPDSYSQMPPEIQARGLCEGSRGFEEY